MGWKPSTGRGTVSNPGAGDNIKDMTTEQLYDCLDANNGKHSQLEAEIDQRAQAWNARNS